MKRNRFRLKISVSGSNRPNAAAETSLSGGATPGQPANSNDSVARPSTLAVRPTVVPFSLLITDDDDAFRETLRSIFEPEGFRTLLADSGEAALDILQRQHVHLALLDQNMPRLTGLETLRIIRQMNSMLPVILMTAERTQQLMRDALSAHAFCVMSKPVNRNVVVYTVQQALCRSYDAPRRELRSGESTP